LTDRGLVHIAHAYAALQIGINLLITLQMYILQYLPKTKIVERQKRLLVRWSPKATMTALMQRN